MKGAPLKATLEALGVLASYSRPRVSDDTPSRKRSSEPSSTVPSIQRSLSAASSMPESGSPNLSLGTTASTCTAASALSLPKSATRVATLLCSLVARLSTNALKRETLSAGQEPHEPGRTTQRSS